MEKKISIVIPMYNAKKHLNRSFVTVLNQTYKNLEIICVNDGSTDGTEEAVKEFMKNDSRIILINQEKAGVSHARNNGLTRVTGEYVQFIDADDEIELDYFEYMVKILEETGSDCAVCNNDHPFFYTHLDDRVYDFTKKSDFIEFYQHTYAPTLPWNKIFKRSVIEGIEFDENLTFAEDEAFFCKCMLNIKKVVTTHKNLYHYYMATKENNGDQDSTLNQGLNKAAFWDNNSSLFFKALQCVPSRIETFEKGISNHLIPLDSITEVIYQRVFDYTFYLMEAYAGLGLPEEGVGTELLHNLSHTFFQSSCKAQEEFGLVFESFIDSTFESRVKDLNHALYITNNLAHQRQDKNIIVYYAQMMVFAHYFVKECNDINSYNVLNICIKEFNENKTATAKLAHEVLENLK